MIPKLPTATGSFGEKPELTFPDADAPEGLQVQVLEQGSGETVDPGDTVVVNYLGQTWGGRVFDNSYDRGDTLNFPVGMGAVIGGFDDGLTGQQIGSRLLLSVPPEHGYGPRGVPQAGISGTDTLVFVVDIVGVQ